MSRLVTLKSSNAVAAFCADGQTAQRPGHWRERVARRNKSTTQLSESWQHVIAGLGSFRMGMILYAAVCGAIVALVLIQFVPGVGHVARANGALIGVLSFGLIMGMFVASIYSVVLVLRGVFRCALAPEEFAGSVLARKAARGLFRGLGFVALVFAFLVCDMAATQTTASEIDFAKLENLTFFKLLALAAWVAMVVSFLCTPIYFLLFLRAVASHYRESSLANAVLTFLITTLVHVLVSVALATAGVPVIGVVPVHCVLLAAGAFQYF